MLGMQSYRGILQMMGYSIAFMLMAMSTQAQERYVLDTTTSTVAVIGSSTLKDWSAQVGTMMGWCMMQTDSGLTISDTELSFVSKSLDGGRGPDMNAKIYKALDASNHEAITYKSGNNTITSAPGAAELEVTSTGQLTIGGISQEVTITLTGTAEPLSLKGTYPLTFSQYDIEPPSALFGTIVCDDEINISIDLQFKSGDE